MRFARMIGGAGAVVLALLVLSACGGSTPKPASVSSLDPASKIPASAVAYASVTVRPQGTARDDLAQAVDELAGKGTFAKLGADITHGLNSGGGGAAALRSWLGQRVGVALTALPSSLSNRAALEDDLVFVLPTSDPSAASDYVSKQKDKPGWLTWKVQGDYLILGGAVGVADALATKRSTSLAASPGYLADEQGTSAGQLASFVLRLSPLVKTLSPLLHSAATPVSFRPAATTLPKVSANAMLMASLDVRAKSFRLDLYTNGVPVKPGANAGSTTGSVAGLPGGSWLALALSGGILTKPSAVTQLNQELAPLLDMLNARGAKLSPPAAVLLQDLLPALGPMSLSIGGSSLATLKGGFQIAPLDAAAGGRLARALAQLVAGQPVKVGSSDGKVLLTYGYAKAKDLLTPSSTLSSDPGFKAALAQLPAGSAVPVYIDFGPIATLGSVLDGKGSDAKVWQVASKLNYLILGSADTHARLVLALK